MKREKGLSMVAIILAVVIGLVIVGIIALIVFAGGNKTPQNPVEDEPQEVVEDKYISDEERMEIMTYLSKIAYVAMIDKREDINLTEEEAMILMATMDIEDEDVQDEDLSGIPNMNIGGETSNNIDLSTLPGINLNTLDAQNTTANTTTNTLTTENNTNKLKLTSSTIQNALFEMFGQKLDDITSVLNTFVVPEEITLPYITKVSSLSKLNSLYTAVFNACPISQNDILNGTNIYGLPSYSIQIKFEKLENPVYCNYRLLSLTVITSQDPLAYHLSYDMTKEKYGVVDNNGIVILEARYAKIEIPNTYVPLFMCYEEENSLPTFINERGVTQFKDYDTIELIKAKSGDTVWNENNILKVSIDGYYGAIDYEGNILFDLEYDGIATVNNHTSGMLILSQNGKLALANTKGDILSEFKYSKIGNLGIDFQPSILVTQTVTEQKVLEMMEQKEYIIGQTNLGEYEIIYTVNKNEEPAIMSTIALGYYMVIGNAWQLYIIGENIPVYVKIDQTEVEKAQNNNTQEENTENEAVQKPIV